MQAPKNVRSASQALAHIWRRQGPTTTTLLASKEHPAESWSFEETEPFRCHERRRRSLERADEGVVALDSERLYRHTNVQPSTSGRQLEKTWSSDKSERNPFFKQDTIQQSAAGANLDCTTTWCGFASSAPMPTTNLPSKGPTLQDFLQSTIPSSQEIWKELGSPDIPYLSMIPQVENGRVYFETYGCQMNVSDMETVLSIMEAAGYTQRAQRVEDADVIFIMTCAIRDNAERKIWQRLGYFKNLKKSWRHDIQSRPEANPAQRPPKVAVLGCMAERLKTKLLESDKLVDVVCGPDAYRDLPRLLSDVERGQAGVNVMLSLDETYADITPVRICKDSVSAYVSIMRGCDNMCSYCIVPFTRGRERSRPLPSIVREVGELWEQGVREVTLLGQNVNSYRDLATLVSPPSHSGQSPLFRDAPDTPKFATQQSYFSPGPSTGHSEGLHQHSSSKPGPAFETGHVERSHSHSPFFGANPVTPTEPTQTRSHQTESSFFSPSSRLPTGHTDSTGARSLQTESSSHPSPGSPTGRDKPSQTQASSSPGLSPGFKTIYKARSGGVTFAHLLDVLSATFPEMRFRFTSPHPKDFPDELIGLLRDRPNVCKAIHLPAQSGSSSILERMRRGYTREAYLALVEKIRRQVPDIAISSDMISGFCGETEADHAETLSLMEAVRYDMAYMFAYSVREKTHAHRRYQNDVPDDVKKRRLAEVIETFRRHAPEGYRKQLGTQQLVLVEGPNKRNPSAELVGTTDGNYKVIFSNDPIPAETNGVSSESPVVRPKRGDYVSVLITAAESPTLGGRALSRTSIARWSEDQGTRTREFEAPVELCA